MNKDFKIKGKGYIYRKECKKWRVQFRYQGFMYLSSFVNTEQECKVKLKQMLKKLKEGTLIPSCLSHKSIEGEERLIKLEAMRRNDGNYRKRNVTEPINIVEKFKGIVIKLKTKGYHWDTKSSKWRVQFSYNGFVYSGGFFGNKKDAAKKVKEMLKAISEGKLAPSAVNMSNKASPEIMEKRKEVLELIHNSKGIYRTVKKDTPVKQKNNLKQINKRFEEAKSFRFEPDTDPEVVLEETNNVIPNKRKTMLKIEGLDIINNLGKTNKQERNESLLDDPRVQELINKAVKNALSEFTNGTKANKRARR